MDADDNRSAPSLRDIATTMQFTDATITPGLRIKAAHLLELRQAVRQKAAKTYDRPSNSSTCFSQIGRKT
jgi:hypothetical protein